MARPAPVPIHDRTLTDGDLEFHWLESGSGVPVVFIHGIPTGPLLWRKVVSSLPDARCLAWEMIGYGESIPQGRGRAIGVAKQSDYLLRWLDLLDIERCILVGHDLGGGVIQNAVMQRPQLATGLVLINAIGYDSWPVPSVKAMQRLRGLMRHLPEPALRMILHAFIRRGHDDVAVAEESFDLHFAAYAQHDAAAAFAHQLRSLRTDETHFIAGSLPTLHIPCRIVWGAADRFQKLEYAERFAHDLHAPLLQVEGGKHFMPEDHPQEVVAAVRELLPQASAAA